MKQKMNRIAAWIAMLTVLLSLLSVSAFATEDGELPPEQPAQEEPAEQPAPEAPAEQPAQEMPTEPMPTDPPATEPVTELPTEAQTEAATETEAMESEPVTDSEATAPENKPRGMYQFTPDGQLTLVDDFEYIGMDADGNIMSKQFITVQSRDGSYFYIIIDRTGDTENVYFLNQVDLADLKYLASNEKQPVFNNGCTCTSKCTAGHVDTSCPVCSVNMSECAVMDGTGKKGDTADRTDNAQDSEPDNTETSKDSKKQQMNSTLMLGLIVLIIGGILYYTFKGKSSGGKGKRRKNQSYFDFDDEDENEELETEPAAPPTERLKPAATENAAKAKKEAEPIIIEEDDFEDEQDDNYLM